MEEFTLKRFLSFVLVLLLGGGGFYFGESQLMTSRAIATPSNIQTPSKTLNILFLGSDARGNEVGRTDTIMVLSVNPHDGRINLVSIPRDTRVNIPHYGNTKITHASTLGKTPEEGIIMTAQAVSQLLNVPIHRYAQVDFQGFEAIIDSVGGLNITLPTPVKDTEVLSINFKAGQHHLTGEEALSVARARKEVEGGDFGRQTNQSLILSSLAKQVLRPESLPRVPALVQSIQKSVKTDLTAPEITILVMGHLNFKPDKLTHYHLEGQGVIKYDDILENNNFQIIPDPKKLKTITVVLQ